MGDHVRGGEGKILPREVMNLLFSPNQKPNGIPTGEPVGIINVDWLSFSVSLLENSTERDNHDWIFSQPRGDYTLLEFQGTNIYKRRLIVYRTDGTKVLTILCTPHSRQIPRDSALVEVANQFLYTGFWWTFELLQEIHPCAFRCLTRLDVCCDFQCTAERLQLIQMLSTNAAYVQGKRDGAQFNSYTFEDGAVGRVPRQLSWGSKNSNIKWKVYNKYLEIFEFDSQGHKICHKPYIAQQWETAGFEVSDMWRCEVSLSPCHKFKFHDRRLTFKDAFNGFVMEDLFISLYMTRFAIRINEGHKDKSNDKRVYLLDNFGQVDRVSQWVNPTPNYREVVEYGATLNAAMAQLSKPEVQVNPAMVDLWHKTAVQTCKLGHLEAYFLNCYGCTIEDFKPVVLQS